MNFNISFDNFENFYFNIRLFDSSVSNPFNGYSNIFTSFNFPINNYK